MNVGPSSPPVNGQPPPPSPALMGALGQMRAVRTRWRFGAFALVLSLGLVWPLYTIFHYPLRRDLQALPPFWVVLGAGLWGLSFIGALAAALVPRSGDVLPSASRASQVSLLALGALLVFTVLWTPFAPGVSLRPEDVGRTLLQSCLGCGKYVLQVAAVFVVVGFLALRRVLPVGGRHMGTALGAAGGALGGLALHFLCPIATTGHVLLSHVVPTILAALAGAIALRALEA
jgi:hypothetical protein